MLTDSNVPYGKSDAERSRVWFYNAKNASATPRFGALLCKKTIAVVSACLCALGLFADVAPIYLKADANGTGDGSSWANAMTSVDAAIALADQSGRPVYAAGGYYRMSATHSLAASLVFRGGFPGVSDAETPADCDSSAYPTYVSPVAATSLRWNHATPNSGEFTISVAALDAAQYPVFSTDGNGRTVFNPPPDYTDDYDSYYISGGNGSYNFASADPAMSFDVSGVWLVGFTGYPFKSKVSSSYDYSSSPRVVSDCRFYGSQGVCEVNNQLDTAADVLTVWIKDCEFRYTYNIRPVIQTYQSGTLIENCTFSDHARTGVGDGGQVIWSWYRYLTVRGCSFSRSTAVSSQGGEDSVNYSAGNLISWNASSRVVIEDCSMEENLSMSQYGWGCSLFAGKSSTVRNCRVTKNRLEVKAVSDRSYALVTGSLRAGVAVSYDGCLFESNTVAEVGGVADSYALGILGNGNEGVQKSAVLNCTFVDNEITAVNPTAGLVRSQGVVYGASSAIAARMAVANCTFSHTEEEGLYDIVMKDTPNNDFYVVNSVFTRGPHAQYEPIYATAPARLCLRACSIGGKIAEGNEPDAVPLERVIAGNGAVVYRPCCKMPSMRTSVDIVTNDISVCALDSTRPPVYVNWKIRNDEDTAWISLLGDTLKTTYEQGGLGDAAGETRPLGSFTRGAVQTLSAAAEAGNTLLVRSEPWGAGVYTPDYWQVVAPGAAPVSVTAAAKDAGSAFSVWKDASDETISSDNPVSLGILSEDITKVTGVFSVPKVQITFDLGQYGSFTDDSTRKVFELEKDTLLVAPEVKENEDWVFTGWTPELPAKVPSSNTTFAGTGVPKSVRVIRLAPADDPVAAAGRGDGSSWADAYRGDLAAAYADAALYRGEVWMKTGAYDIVNPIALMPNVRILGGFAGTETEASAADPAAHPVVITGDTSHNNYYKINNGNTSGGAVIDYATFTFNTPQPADRETYWAATGNNAEDSMAAFTGHGVVTNCVIEGVTITGFKGTAITTDAAALLTLVKCRIVANNTGLNTGADHAAVILRGALTATDCDFWAMHSPLTIYNGDASHTEPVTLTRCTFRFNHGTGSGTGGAFSFDASQRDLVLDHCEFSDNYIWEYQGYQRPPVYIATAKTMTMRDSVVQRNTYKKRCATAFQVAEVKSGLYIERCVFRDNQKIGHGSDSGKAAAALTLGTLRNWDVNQQHYICDTLFVSNTVVRQSESNSGTMQVVNQASCLRHSYGYLAVVNCSFVDNFCDTTGAANGSTGGTVYFDANYGQATLLNCIFSGNEVKGHTTTDLRCGAPYVTYIVNTVFSGKADGYEPLYYSNPSKNPFSLAHCRLTGYTAEKYASSLGTKGFDIDNSADVPKPAKAPAEGANGAWALDAHSHVRGTPVWKGNDGLYYFYLPEVDAAKPWRAGGKTLAAVPTSAANPATLVPDAFGVTPTNRKNSPFLGPVNGLGPGLKMLVR